MTGEPGLRLVVGDPTRRITGFLNCDGTDAADVPFRFGDEFPFEDGAADELLVGAAFDELPHHAQLYFLLEIRRIVRPCGRIRLNMRQRIARVLHLAAMAGLEPVDEDSGTHVFTKRARGVAGDPQVSIVIPAYNVRFFAACLDSALAQTYSNVEIVVRDDSADTRIEEIVCARSGGHPIRYARNPVRLMVRANYAAGFEDAQGEFVKYLCDDDVLAPDCVLRLLDGFRRSPDTVLATSHRRRIDEDGRALPDQPATQPIVDADAVIAGYTLANAMLMAGLNIVGEPSTVLFRKADLLDQRPHFFNFDGAHGHGAIDMVMWAALLLKGNAVYVRASLSDFRIHPGQRQLDPGKQRRNIDSIRELQAAWLAFKLFDKVPPDRLLAKPFPPGDDDWAAQPVLSFSPRSAPQAAAGLPPGFPTGGHWG